MPERKNPDPLTKTFSTSDPQDIRDFVAARFRVVAGPNTTMTDYLNSDSGSADFLDIITRRDNPKLERFLADDQFSANYSSEP